MTAPWRAVCLASGALALTVTAAVLGLGMLPGETWLREVVLAAVTPPSVIVAWYVNTGGTWRVLVPATLLLLGLCPDGRRRWWLWCGVLVLAPLVGEAWQEMVGRPRPVGAALGFPSGHATASATYAVAAVYLLDRTRLPGVLRRALQIAAPLGALAIGLARLVLGAHWPADVVGGFALGSTCAAGAAWWDASHPPADRVVTTGHPRREVIGLVLLGLLLSACGQDARTGGGPAKPLAVASFYPMYEFTRQVAGDRADVRSLIPPGVEPHEWEPAPQDVAQIQKARLFVYNGVGLEPWADRVLAELVGKSTVVVRVTDGLPLVGIGPAASAAKDPHTWLDPVLARAQVEAIRVGLARADPANAAAYAENARAFGDRLDTLDQAFQAGLRNCARRDIFTSHAAFGYLARRYGLVQVPLMGLVPEAEPSPTDLAALVRLARERKVRYVFFETLVSPKLADTLAREIGAQTLMLNPVEGLTEKEQAAGQGYVSVMEENLKQLRTALECR